MFDSELPSHTDEKIIEALNGFEVEEWDWDKIDLSSEVVFAASSDSVREISLQASGNDAVLQGWCAPGGFGNKEKFPKVIKPNWPQFSPIPASYGEYLAS